MSVWTLIVEVPEDWGDPDELGELLAEVDVRLREIHFEDMLERRPDLVEDLQALLRASERT